MKNAINETNCKSVTVVDAGSRTYGIMWNFRCCYTISHPMPTAKLNWVFRILIAPISKYPIHSLNGVIFLQNILWGFNLTGLYFNIAWGRRTRKKKQQTFIVDQQIRENITNHKQLNISRIVLINWQTISFRPKISIKLWKKNYDSRASTYKTL